MVLLFWCFVLNFFLVTEIFFSKLTLSPSTGVPTYTSKISNSKTFTNHFFTLTFFLLWARNAYHLKMDLLSKHYLYNKRSIFICSFKFADAYASTFVRYFASLGNNIVVGCSQAAYGGKLFIFSTADTSVNFWNLFVERYHCSQSIMCRAYSYNSNLHCFIGRKKLIKYKFTLFVIAFYICVINKM